MIEECLYGAVSDLQGVARFDNYLKLAHKKYSGSTLDLLIYEIDRDIDQFSGRWDKTRFPAPHYHSLKAKYELVYELVNSLGDKFLQLKECVKKEMASLYFDHENIKDIADLQAHLLEKLEAKSIANLYNKEIVQGTTIKTNSAKLGSGSGSTEWTEDQSKAFHKMWKAKSVPWEQEKTDKKKVIDYIKKIDEENKDLHNKPVRKCQLYLDFLKENKISNCHSCFSNGCLNRYRAASQLNLEFNGGKKCDRSAEWKFGHLKDLNERGSFKEAGKLKTQTVSLQPFQAPPSSNSFMDSLYRFEAQQEDLDDLPANIITATRGRYTAKTIPDISKTFEHKRADLVCDICGEDEMSGFDIIDHWVDEHDVNIHERDVSARVKDWNKALEKYEDRNDFSDETEFITDPYTYSPKKEPTALPPGPPHMWTYYK